MITYTTMTYLFIYTTFITSDQGVGEARAQAEGAQSQGGHEGQGRET